MMNLSTMGTVVSTLDDDRASPIANEIASRWHHDAGSVRFFRASANFLFTFEHAAAKYMLRFVDAAERSAELIRAELDFVNYLASKRISTPTPVRSAAGNWVETVSTAQGSWNAAVFEHLEGESFELDTLEPAQALRWGETLGKLHAASRGYVAAQRPSWHDHIAFVRSHLGSDVPLTAALDKLDKRLSHLPVQDDNFGLIHYDFELDNLIWNRETVGIVDFDDCARYWFAADIAFALRDAFGDSPNAVDLENPIARQFLSGYRSARQIHDADLQFVPLFLALHNLVTISKLQDALKPSDAVVEPEWLIALRTKLQTKINFYRAELEKFHTSGFPEA
jgi:Ser/Thr protein kinase RdoA (MazF antagonist)